MVLHSRDDLPSPSIKENDDIIYFYENVDKNVIENVLKNYGHLIKKTYSWTIVYGRI